MPFDTPQQFFVEEIKSGLEKKGGSLTPEEEEVLALPVVELPNQPGFSPEKGKELQEKCISALTEIYKQHTKPFEDKESEKRWNEARKMAGLPSCKRSDRDFLLYWREHIVKFRERSDTVLSAIVQEWYLTEGRSLEKSAARRSTGCLIVFIIFSLGLFLF